MAGWTTEWADGRGTRGSVYRLEYIIEGDLDFALLDWPNESVFTATIDNAPGLRMENVADYSPLEGRLVVDVLIERSGVLGRVLRERIVAPDRASLTTEAIPFVGFELNTTWKLNRVKYLRHESSKQQTETREEAEQFQEELGEGSLRDTLSEGAEIGERLGQFVSVGAVLLLAVLVVTTFTN